MLKNKKFLFLTAFLAFALIFVAACGDDNGNGDNGDNGSNGETAETDGGETDGGETGVETDGGETDAGVGGGGVGVSGYADEFVLGIGGEIPSLDPHAQNMLASSQVLYHTMETLVNQDVDLIIYPGLAESWEQIDDVTWQFNLRQDVYFHNGEKLTAEDVAFSLSRGADAPQVAPVIGMIDAEGIEVIDDYTVNIATNYPFAPFLNHLAHNAAAIMHAGTVGDVEPGEAADDLIIGSGPYQVIENVSGEVLIMERWDDFHGDIPHMRQITFRIIMDPSARTMALETGEVDAILAPQPTDVDRLENHADITMHETVGLGMEYIILNNYHIPDVNVRRAINYALDIDMIVDITTEGTLVPAAGFVNNITFGHNPDFEGFPFDIDRARELMVEAGYSGEAGAGDVEIELFANVENVVRQQQAEMVQGQLNEIGINIEITTMEFNAMNELLQDRQVAMATLGWGTVTGDADYALFPLFHSSSHSPGTNHALFDNAEFDDLIEQARASTDEAERLELYREAQDILHYYAPWILISNTIIRIPAQNNVGGVVVMAHQGHNWSNVYFTE